MFIRAEKKKKEKHETQNANAQLAQSKQAHNHVNFFNRSCSLGLQPKLKPNFVNFLNELLINALRVPINRTLNYQGQGFSPN